MRAKTGSKRIIAFTFILLLAVVLFAFALSVSSASASTVTYLTAEVTKAGEFVPAGFVYDGSPVSLGFALYASEDRSSWVRDDTLASEFTLQYTDLSTGLTSDVAPSAVGSYVVKVVAKNSSLSECFTIDADLIVTDTVIGSATFFIYNQNLFLNNTLLDAAAYGSDAVSGEGNILLPDNASVAECQDIYDNLVAGTSLILGGAAVDGAKYTLTVQYYNAGAYSSVTTIDKVGAYRLKVQIDSSVDLSDTVASSTLTKDGDDYLFYREFSVTCQELSFALTASTAYEGSAPAVSLDSASLSKLSSLGSYQTLLLYYPSEDGVARSIDHDPAPNVNVYHPTEVGRYVYRIVFTSDASTYGVKIGDYVDLSFEILPIPFVVKYYYLSADLSDSDQYLGEFDEGFLCDTNEALVVTPIFYDLNGNEIDSVYTDSGKKYTLSYQYHNGAMWTGVAALTTAGRYKVTVAFTQTATVNGYLIPDVEHVFVFSVGRLEVKTTKTKYYLPQSGTGSFPQFSFTSQSGDESANVGTYTVNYYKKDGTALGTTAPTTVGNYVYELTLQNAYTALGVPAGAMYRGEYAIVYRPIETQAGDDVQVIDSITNDVILDKVTGDDRDFDVTYYQKSGNVYKMLGEAPTVEGQYLKQIVIKKALPNYRLAVGDVFTSSFSVNGTAALIGIDTSTLDLTYDGGVKVPGVSFTRAGVPFALNPLADYQTAYYRYDGANYVACDAPVLAGTYRFVVTFLKSDPANGIVRGAYVRSAFIISPAKYNVTFTVSEESHDLVYDAAPKTYVATFSYKSRPVAPAHSVKYAVQGDAFGSSAFTNVGDYNAKVVLDDDKSGSISLIGGTIDFSIVKLSLAATFHVPLGYNRMWRDSFVTPNVTYLCQNGRNINNTLPAGVNVNQTLVYHPSDSDSLVDPIMPGNYRQVLTLGNANVVLAAVDSIGDNDEVVSSPTLIEGAAQQAFKITPREVKVVYTYDAAKDSLYFTGAESEDRKGVTNVAFMAYGTTNYTEDISAYFVNDYKIYYYTSNYSGTVSGESSLLKPYEKSYYVARVKMEPDGTNDDYLAKYTFKSGMYHDDPLGEAALSADCYVDDVFRIKDQNKIKVIYQMPDTFAANDEYKTIAAEFYNNFSKIDFTEGAGEDYRISYLDADSNENYTSFKESGTYRVKITFLKDFVAYRLDDYLGDYTSGNDYYIKAGDTLVYTFEIFTQRVMKVAISTTESLYYDARVKSHTATFTVSDTLSLTDCAVTLTIDTHYRLRYYKKASGVFSLLEGAPSVPGDYAVEVVFLTDLLDYSYADKTVLKDGFYYLSEGEQVGKVASPFKEFTINKAIFVLSGVSVKDKSFDGKTTATFNDSAKKITIKEGCGVNVHNLTAASLSGSLTGDFDSKFPAEDIVVTLNEDSKYALPQAYRDFYKLEYPTFTATISKASISVVLTDGKSAHEGSTVLVEREYNPYSVESEISFHLSFEEALLNEIFPDLDKDKSVMTVGALSYEKGLYGGFSVGDYPIVLNTLALNDAAPGAIYAGHPISDLFTLVLEKDCYYRILVRPITVSVAAGQSKVYGDDEPNQFIVTITSGRLIYGDRLSYTARRAEGNNAGRYLISLYDLKVIDNKGEDVSANYKIESVLEYFTINRRELKISPKDQSATYLNGFSHTDNAYVLDMTRKNTSGVYGVDVTDRFLTNPPVGGDRLTGKLSYANKAEENDPLKFRILQGSMNTVTSALGKNVTANYVITFDETPKYYTITQVEIVVKLKEDAVLQKYYGDKEPIIAYTIDTAEMNKLSKLTLVSTSSVGRAKGEVVGEYRLYPDNSARSFLVYDDGIDVSDFFSFSVRQKVDGVWRLVTAETKFTILPRPVVVTVEEASYENTGRQVTPVIKYLNTNGSRLSATLREDLESRMNIQVPEIEYHDGENLVTPQLVGEADPNYTLSFEAGKITIVYLQNVLTVTPLEKTDEVYNGRKFMLSGIMLYKTVRFYKIETANGEQPSHDLSISLPVDEEIAGDGLVVVALRSDGTSKAFSFVQSGQTVVYTDGSAYYVAIAEVQEWFYVIWGAIIVLALVALYFLVRLIIFLVKKAKRKSDIEGIQQTQTKNKKKKKKNNALVIQPTGTSVQAESGASASGTDSLFSDTAVTEEPKPQPIAPAEDLSVPNADDLFTDEAPTEIAPTAPATPAQPADSVDTAVSDSVLSDAPIDSAEDADAVAAAMDIAPVMGDNTVVVEEPKDAKKDKKEKDKKDKKSKKEKEDKNKPKGFMPTAFKPKGDRSAAYAPTRSFSEDLFGAEQQANEANDDGSSLLSDSAISDGAITAPPKPSTPSGGDDELIISRGGGFSFDDSDEDDKNKKDDDMM